MAPFDIMSHSGTFLYVITFLLIGFGFGFALEMSGFGDTRKLAAQFYLTDMTVLKVMFTAIIVAMVLIFSASAFGLLDFGRVYVNETYLWPGIVGGLIMGVGFVIGGFCPGTSLVAVATLKLDGIFFSLGCLIGVWLFGETVGSFQPFFLSSSMGRFMLPELFGLPLGVTVLIVVVGALLMFWGGEIAEAYFGRKESWAKISLLPRSKGKLAGVAVLVSLGLVLVAKGQPTPAKKFELMASTLGAQVDDRSIFVHPAEVAELRKDVNLKVEVLDVRDESDFNLFHIGGSRRIGAADLTNPAYLRRLLEEPATTVTFVVGNGEEAALAAWKALKAQGVGNLYVIEGGINHWLELFSVAECAARPMSQAANLGPDALSWQFAFAAGDREPASWPELPVSHRFRSPCGYLQAHAEGTAAGHHGITWPTYEFTKKVKLQRKVAVKGGCG